MSRNKDPRLMCQAHRILLARRCANCAEKGPHYVPAGAGVEGFYLCEELPPPPVCRNCQAIEHGDLTRRSTTHRFGPP